MSDSVRSHRPQPTRLPHPWDSPGKNIGVGCHFLLQCMKVKSESEVTESCPTLSDPMDCSLQGSSIHGIFQARVLEWGAIGLLQGIQQKSPISLLKNWLPLQLSVKFKTKSTLRNSIDCFERQLGRDWQIHWRNTDQIVCQKNQETSRRLLLGEQNKPQALTKEMALFQALEFD